MGIIEKILRVIQKIMIASSAVIILTIIFVLAASFLLFGITDYKDRNNFASKVRHLIPEQIKTEEIIANDKDINIGGGGSCGGITFKLSKETVDQIRNQGLLYFDTLTPKRIQNHQAVTDQWRAWKESPITKDDQEATRIVDGCLEGLENFLRKKNYSLSSDTKGYYTYATDNGYRNLWIFPEWEIIVYSYNY